MFQRKALFPVPAILVLLLSACGGAAPTEVAEIQEESTVAPEEPAATEVEAATETPQIIASAWLSQFPALPAAPQEVSIPTVQGRSLAGIYYTAKVNPAPIVVLMHWAGGDKTDWRAITPWLQNRADELSHKVGFARLIGQVEGPWLDPSWFPDILPEASFGVLVFDYGGFGDSPLGEHTELDDSLAALEFASTLEGVNPDQIITMGASIGADGAVDACYLFNMAVAEDGVSGRCVGAMALSPGNFFMAPFGTADFTFSEAAAALLEDGNYVGCLGAIEDAEAGRICIDLGAFTSGTVPPTPFVYEGDNHGMFLIDPALTPFQPPVDENALQIFLQFLEHATGLPIIPN
ncbi:MAG: hypothetical protein M1347_03920 [Chloroflexi bacterium]|nr:hypothetical protein [Chloroflexota bacterium]